MRFFEGDGKYNWVDENNVFVGYSSSQDCCEWASWFLAEECQEGPPEDEDGFAKEKDLPQELDWENWIFDTTFFCTNCPNSTALEDGGIAVFCLQQKHTRPNGYSYRSKPRYMYLHLFNCHNGYYGHGFKWMVGDQIKFEGDL